MGRNRPIGCGLDENTEKTLSQPNPWLLPSHQPSCLAVPPGIPGACVREALLKEQPSCKATVTCWPLWLPVGAQRGTSGPEDKGSERTYSETQNHKEAKRLGLGWGLGSGGWEWVPEGWQKLRLALELLGELQEQSHQTGGAQCQGCPSPSSSLNKDDN